MYLITVYKASRSENEFNNIPKHYSAGEQNQITLALITSIDLKIKLGTEIISINLQPRQQSAPYLFLLSY